MCAVKEERKGFLEEIGEAVEAEYSDSWVGLGVVRGMFLVVWDLILCHYLCYLTVFGVDIVTSIVKIFSFDLPSSQNSSR